MKRPLLLAGGCAIAALAAYAILDSTSDTPAPSAARPDGAAMVQIKLPALDGNAAIGQRIFDNACSTCHGPNAVGKEGAGPPLIHVIYEPAHHGDEAFQRAVALGVKSHHWRFGDMPPVAGLTRGDVAMVIAYIRQIQRANGIH
jgi:mono/diheme cytochrome c family protein